MKKVTNPLSIFKELYLGLFLYYQIRDMNSSHNVEM